MRLFTTRRVWTGRAVKQARADQAKAADQAAMADMEDLFGSEAESEAERKGAAGGRAPRMVAWGVRLLFGRRRGARQRDAPKLLPSAPCMPGGASLSRGDGRGVSAWRVRDRPGLMVEQKGGRVACAPPCTHGRLKGWQ